ncbi:hypothetical protein PSHT_15518 [Puccinia striiformis]|uniref:Uncharacterized protein n=1 Tax=Puccinia striiformis TaxID=27350 RepID=A0A2S4UEJ0_9BASI|nr:hypothetical protein PSHT_15518 [Puccinia striiformis]
MFQRGVINANRPYVALLRPPTAGQAIAPLLAASDECAQQLMADKIIDAAKDLTNSIKSPDTRKQMIALAIEYRQEPAKNPELKGLVQKQDPANDPNLFFDHLVTTNASTVVLDSQPNTRPFGGASSKQQLTRCTKFCDCPTEKPGTSKTTPSVPKSTSTDANPSGDPKTTTDTTPTVPKSTSGDADPKTTTDTTPTLPKSTSGDADPKTTTDTTPTVPKSTSGDADPKTTTDTTPTVPKSTSGDADPKTTTDTTPTVPKSTSDNTNPSDNLKSTKSGTGSSTEEGTEDEGGCGGSGDDADNEKKEESSTPPTTLKDTTGTGEKAEDKGTTDTQESLKDTTSGGGGQEDKGTVTNSAPTGDGVKAESTTTETNPAPTGNSEKAEDKGTTESQDSLKDVTSGGGGKEDKGTVTDSTPTGNGVKAESTTTETNPAPTGNGEKAEDKGTTESQDSLKDATSGGGGKEDKGTVTILHQLSTTTKTNPAPTGNGEKAEDKGTTESQDSLKDVTSGGGGKEDKGTVTDSTPTGNGVKAESTTTETNPAPTGNGEKAEDKGTTESQDNLKDTTTETTPTPTGSGDKAEDKGTGNGEKVEEKDSNTDADEGDCGGGSGEDAEDKGTKTLSTTGGGISSSPQGSSTTPTSTGDAKPNPSDADPKLKDAGNPPPSTGGGSTPGATSTTAISFDDLLKQLNATIDLTNVPNKECHDFRIEYGQGFPGREAKDFAYQPLQAIFGHGAALTMCDSLHNVCGVKQPDDAATFTPCMDLVNALGKVVKDGSKADLWNLAFNMKTTYRTEMATGPGKGGKGDGTLLPDQKKPSGSKTPSASPPGTTQPPSTTQPQSTPNGNVNQMDMNANMDQNMQNMNGNTNPKDAGNPPPSTGGGTPPGAPPTTPISFEDLRKQLNATIDVTKIPNKDCHDFRIEFGSGFPGREAKDFAYQPLQPIWSHGAALSFPSPPDMGIIAHSMCDSLHNVCGVKQPDDAATFTPCMDLVNALGKVVKDGSKADLWNLAFNMRTTYRTEMATGPGKGGKGDGKLYPDDSKPPGTKTPSASPPGTTQPPSTTQPPKYPNGNVNQMDMNGNMDQNQQNMQNMQNQQNMQNMQNQQNMQNMNQGNPGQGGK